jgi:hypothetical protein
MPTTYAIPNGATQFAATLYIGNGTTQSITNGASTSGTTFQPDFVWIKVRNTAGTNHRLFDSVRGVTKALSSDLTSSEFTESGLTSFDSSGFSVGSQVGSNGNTYTIVGWQWKASNAAAVTNTAGSISSQVSANPTAGFSIVTFTCPASGNFTVGHGLGVAPAMFILKTRNGVDGWYVYHKNLATPASNYLVLNTTATTATSTGIWGNTNPTSTVLTLGTNSGIGANLNGVLYCFAEIAGYSKFGSYTGNGATDGTFVYLGFRPRWVLLKLTSSAGGGWYIYDTSRNTYNVMDKYLRPDATDAETTFIALDALSNGFKIRTTSTQFNGSGSTYIYAAFAENPFKYANAR